MISLSSFKARDSPCSFMIMAEMVLKMWTENTNKQQNTGAMNLMTVSSPCHMGNVLLVSLRV